MGDKHYDSITLILKEEERRRKAKLSKLRRDQFKKKNRKKG